MMLTRRDNLFDEMFRDPFFARPIESTSAQIMKTDIRETDEQYIIEMDLPGYDKEDIHVELKEGYLTINAGREDTKEEEDQESGYICRERYTGGCSRRFHVGNEIRRESIKASFKNGVLCLSIPKETPQQIEEHTRIAID